MQIEKECLVCGNKFTTNKQNKLYCSPKCTNYRNNHKPYNEKKLDPITKKCLYCGNEFKDNISGNRLYCCGSCKRKDHYIKLPTIIKNCLNCGKEFVGRNGGKENIYCCQKCSKKYFRDFLMTKEQKNKEKEMEVFRSKNNPLTKYKEIELGAKYRKLSFNISFDLFLEKFWKKECIYCGNIIDGGGIDRVDSSIGYEPDNCVPCCGLCNRMKNNSLLADFFSHIKQIYKYSNLNKLT